MKIKLLKLRERFEENFISSFGQFLKDKFDWEGEIFWSSPINNEDNDDQMVLYANDVLNVIFPKNMSMDRLKPFITEYRYHENLIRRILQTIYVSFAIKPLFKSFVSSRVLIVRNPPVSIENFLILPGNHSHRIIDYNENVSLVFAKNDFDYNYFRAEAESRINYHFLPVPKILEYVQGRRWFSEELVNGLPLNRLDNDNERKLSLAEAGLALNKLYSLTSRRVNWRSYVDGLNDTIKSKISLIEGFVLPSEVALLNQLLDKLYRNVEAQYKYFPSKIELVMSHGDFQPANILRAKSRIWLTDWEYSSERSVFFDSFYFVVNSISIGNFASRVDILLHKIEEKSLPVSFDEDFLGASKIYLITFLLELYLLKLSEVSSIGITKKLINIEPWVNEVLQMDCIG